MVDDFDLDAAWIRRAQGDLRSFMEAFGARMQGALADRTTVERKRDGLLSKTTHVREVSFRGETGLYKLVFDKGQLRATRAKLVRGVVISTAELQLPEWLAEVRREVQALAGSLGGASDTLAGFL